MALLVSKNNLSKSKITKIFILMMEKSNLNPYSFFIFLIKRDINIEILMKDLNSIDKNNPFICIIFVYQDETFINSNIKKQASYEEEVDSSFIEFLNVKLNKNLPIQKKNMFLEYNNFINYYLSRDVKILERQVNIYRAQRPNCKIEYLIIPVLN